MQNKANQIIMQQIIEYKARGSPEDDAKENKKQSLNFGQRRELAQLLVKAHLGWIIFDVFMSIVILLSDLLYGDHDPNIVKTTMLLRKWDNFLTVSIFQGVFTSVQLCLTWGSGKKPYDFLIAQCCKNIVGVFFHFVFMALMIMPLIMGLHKDFFCPWSQTPVRIALYSYCLRTIVVTLFAIFYAQRCIVPKK